MDKKIIYALSVIGFLLVFTACLNFINLATAQSVTRSREVGIRKVLGSVRSQLFWQFTTETGLVVLFASVLAFVTACFVLPYINTFFSTHINLDLFSDVQLLFFFLLLISMVTFLSGTYPGIVLSGFKPALALKGRLTGKGSGNFNVRRVLIITQVTISQVLLIGLIVILYQMKYFKQQDMGFVKKAVVMIPVGSRDLKMHTLKDQFAQIPQVENVSICFASPASDTRWGTSITFDNRSESENFSASFRGADEHYLATFGIELVAGRNLVRSDTVREFLVNETFANKLGLSSHEDILGKNISFNGVFNGPVVGVVNDFHDQSLRAEISPIFITTLSENYNEYAVKIKMTDVSNTLTLLEKAWITMYPDQIYEYDFLDNKIAGFYRMEETMLTIIQVFAFIAIFIGCMGLYGLVSYISMQRTKEIGIRKVLGGNILQMLWIFGKEFSRLVMIAFLIAAPIGWTLMSRWLSNYAYRVEINAWVFILELIIIAGLVMLTVGFRSLKAAMANPAESLKSE